MNINPKDMHVVLLAGGTSGEREISLASGKGASDALREAGFEVTQLDPAEKEDLKRLIDGGFDVAFLCMHGKRGEDGTLQGLLEMLPETHTPEIHLHQHAGQIGPHGQVAKQGGDGRKQDIKGQIAFVLY